MKSARRRVEELISEIHMLSEGDVSWTAEQLRNLANRIKPERNDKPQPTEDPEEWVEITDPEHVVRECDWLYLVCKGFPIVEAGWVECSSNVGKKVSDFANCIFRCRRKDLPKPAKPRRTVTVPKWLVIYSTGESAVIEQSAKPLVGVEFHRVGETTYEIEEV